MQCPVCRANQNEGSGCRRCKADLSMLIGLEEQRIAAIATAKRAAQEGRYDEALALLDHAEYSRKGEDVLRLRVAVLLLRRDFIAAWKCYHEVGRSISE